MTKRYLKGWTAPHKFTRAEYNHSLLKKNTGASYSKYSRIYKERIKKKR